MKPMPPVYNFVRLMKHLLLIMMPEDNVATAGSKMSLPR
jgi:hypothetical protein